MILCDTHCIPCCDFCRFALHDEWDEIRDGALIHHKGEPIGCTYYDDEKHRQLAESCSFCEYFECFNTADVHEFVCKECGEKINNPYSRCPICSSFEYYPYTEERSKVYREDWIALRKYKCVKCGKWHWDISRWEYKCECGSTVFEDRTDKV